MSLAGEGERNPRLIKLLLDGEIQFLHASQIRFEIRRVPPMNDQYVQRRIGKLVETNQQVRRHGMLPVTFLQNFQSQLHFVSGGENSGGKLPAEFSKPASLCQWGCRK